MEPNSTARGHLEQGHDAQESGLAGSVRSEDPEDFSLAQRNAIDRQGQSFPVADFQIFAEEDIGAHSTILCALRRYG